MTLFLLLCTGYLVLDGSRSLATAGDSSRFSGWMFTLLAPLQLLVLSSLAAVGAASSVAQEKDRRTLILLLMTRLSGFEVVVGKLTAVLLAPFAMLLCGLPLFCSFPLLGGVSPWQVLLVFVVTAATILLAGSVGTVMGMWREKTFQAIALTVLRAADVHRDRRSRGPIGNWIDRVRSLGDKSSPGTFGCRIASGKFIRADG